MHRAAAPEIIRDTDQPKPKTERRKTMAIINGSALSSLSQTEVWVAESPTHMIHFNGERFLGPY